MSRTPTRESRSGRGMLRTVVRDEFTNIRTSTTSHLIRQRHSLRTNVPVMSSFDLHLKEPTSWPLLGKSQTSDIDISVSYYALRWRSSTDFSSLDVFRPDATISDQQAGSQLIVDQKYKYSDLDKLVVNHVKTMSRHVECNYELLIVSSSSSYVHESQNASMARPKPSYGAGRRTSGQTPARKPGHKSSISAMSSMKSMPVRSPSTRTPRRFGASSAFSVVPRGYADEQLRWKRARRAPYSWAAELGLRRRVPATVALHQDWEVILSPPGMNPQRASMIQESGGWGTAGGGWRN